MGFRCNARSLIAPSVAVRGDPRCIFHRYSTASHLPVSFPTPPSSSIARPPVSLTISAIKCILPPINSRDRALLRLNRVRSEENCPVRRARPAAPFPLHYVTMRGRVDANLSQKRTRDNWILSFGENDVVSHEENRAISSTRYITRNFKNYRAPARIASRSVCVWKREIQYFYSSSSLPDFIANRRLHVPTRERYSHGILEESAGKIIHSEKWIL